MLFNHIEITWNKPRNLPNIDGPCHALHCQVLEEASLMGRVLAFMCPGADRTKNNLGEDETWTRTISNLNDFRALS